MVILSPAIVERALHVNLETVGWNIRPDAFLLEKFVQSHITNKICFQMLLLEYTVKQNHVTRFCASGPLFILVVMSSHGSEISETILGWSLV